ncbi:hypothetical protein D8S78_22925 [Natrialba swarupiae]|nr:hypothetical protein [Natrialba swarupiae]
MGRSPRRRRESNSARVGYRHVSNRRTRSRCSARSRTSRTIPASAALDDSLGAVASRSTYLIGGAVRDAGTQLSSTLVDRISTALDCSPADVRIDDGTVHTDRSTVSISDLLEEEITVVGRATADDAPASYGAHFAEVVVDPGRVTSTYARSSPHRTLGLRSTPKW